MNGLITINKSNDGCKECFYINNPVRCRKCSLPVEYHWEEDKGISPEKLDFSYRDDELNELFNEFCVHLDNDRKNIADKIFKENLEAYNFPWSEVAKIVDGILETHHINATASINDDRKIGFFEEIK